MQKHLINLRNRVAHIFFGPPYHPANHDALSPRGTVQGVRLVLLVTGALWLLLLGGDLLARFGQRTPKSWRYFQGPHEFNEHPNVQRHPEPIRDDLVRNVAVPSLTAPYLQLEDTTPTFIATNGEGFRQVRAHAPYTAVLCGDSFSNNNNFADSLAANTGFSTRNLAIEGRGTLTMARYLATPPVSGSKPKIVFWVSTQRASIADYKLLDTLQYQLRHTTALGNWQASLLWPANLDLYLTGTSTLKPTLDALSKQIKWHLLHKSTELIVRGRQDLPANQSPMLFLAADEGIRPNATSMDETVAIADHIARIQRKLAAQGQQLVFAVAPEKSYIYQERLPDGMKARTNYIPALNKALQARGVRVVDISQGLRQAALAQPKRLFYYATDTHWTPAGQGVASRIIADSLSRWNLLPSISSSQAK